MRVVVVYSDPQFGSHDSLAEGAPVVDVLDSVLPLERAIAMEAEAFATCFASPDQKEGMGAFLEKRKPNFVGGE